MMNIAAHANATMRVKNLYLEQECPVIIDSLFDETNGNNIRLKLNLQLTEVQNPRKLVHLFLLHCSPHGFAHQPENKSTFKIKSLFSILISQGIVFQCVSRVSALHTTAVIFSQLS